MKEFTVKIVDPIGLHARPTTLVSQAAAKFKSDSFIISNGREANLKSIMNIMALGIKHGAEVTVKVLGEDEEEAIKALHDTFVSLELI
ncbi:HPr family phosphocarrier protein [Mycoplasma sp. OR1901]|uniref:HPr family phosphocarrier protein n=1 Tax=Mycoplasma sp. OR1901 TaxID=2742195 RepID=UPI001583318B|nr:HPr family phosphocarrier protein [Mycoplasma sp. OR1901]QKT05470.1 HPr family phosphocarrier protein [Mycoplasma sp. OR1901]